jgi:hypothetical protein
VSLRSLNQLRSLLLIAVEDGADELVFRLEVVVDVSEWNVGVKGVKT